MCRPMSILLKQSYATDLTYCPGGEIGRHAILRGWCWKRRTSSSLVLGTNFKIMIKDEDIVFITTTLNSKWLNYSRALVSKFFPNSQHIIKDGSRNWPYAWFYWLEDIKHTSSKWFVHLDEDCFLTGKQELIDLISKMESDNLTLSAVSDAYHHYRGANPVAINSFFLVGNVSHFNQLEFKLDGLEFWHDESGWKNSQGILYDPVKHRHDFEYPHEKIGNGENCSYEQEPYYMILWLLKENGMKFNYLYPYFDERFKSTNPRISSDTADICIHMWYTRQWNSSMDVHGLPNITRYESVEKEIKTLIEC